MEEKTRNSGLELLRIFAILMIICIHAFGLVQGMAVNQLGKEVTRLVNCLCNIGVSCFVLISGYFGVKRDWMKIARLEMMVIFFSFCTTGLLAVAFPEVYNGPELLELIIKSCIPVISRKHWFYSCYICLLLLSPWLNAALERMTKRQMMGLLATMLVLFSICPTFLYFEIMQDGGKGLVNMILLYVLGRYIRKFGDFQAERKRVILIFVLLLALSYFTNRAAISFGGVTLSFIKDNSIVNIGMAVMLLYLCKDAKWHLKCVNGISSHVFGIYILNVPVMECIHTYVLKIDESKVYSNWFPVWTAQEVLMTFLVCLLCDLLRRLLFGGFESRLLNLLCELGEKKNDIHCEKIELRIKEFFENKEK